MIMSSGNRVVTVLFAAIVERVGIHVVSMPFSIPLPDNEREIDIERDDDIDVHTFNYSRIKPKRGGEHKCALCPLEHPSEHIDGDIHRARTPTSQWCNEALTWNRDGPVECRRCDHTRAVLPVALVVQRDGVSHRCPDVGQTCAATVRFSARAADSSANR